MLNRAHHTTLKLIVRLRSGLSARRWLQPSWSLPSSKLERTTVIWPQSYGWRPAFHWGDPIRKGFGRYTDVVVRDLPQSTPGVITFFLTYKGREWPVAIDYADKTALPNDAINEFAVYFKLQFDSGGYDVDTLLPGGYTSYSFLYTIYDIVGRWFTNGKKKYEVFGRYSLDFARKVRSDAVRILAASNRFTYEGGIFKKRYASYLNDVARSRVCVDLPGNGPFCFRLIDYMAVGACIVAFPHKARLHVPLVDGQHVAYVREDLSDLEEVCAYYCENRREQERLARNARGYFERYLHHDQLAAYYLNSIYRILDS